MNELLQKHGCANVFTVPEGLKELMADITREVLRDQPPKIFDYIANYLSVLLITREHGVLAVRILDDLCDCKPSVSEHLLQLGMEQNQAGHLSQIIKEEVEGLKPEEGKEKIKETQILKKILTRMVLDEETAAKVCQIARNAYRDYWYRKKLMEKNLKMRPDEPWEVAAERTLNLYKSTKPSYSELTRATQKIQAAYRGYHVRRNVLRHLKTKAKKKRQTAKVEIPGPPIDVADSREIDLGPVIDIQVREENVVGMFDEAVSDKLGLPYDPMKTITHVEPGDNLVVPDDESPVESKASRMQSRVAMAKSLTSKSMTGDKSLASKSVTVDKSLASKSMTSKSMTAKSMASRMDQMEAEGDDEPIEQAAKSRALIGAPVGELSQQKITFTDTPELIEDTADVPEDITAPGTGTEGDEVPEDITGQTDEGSVAPSSAPDTDMEEAVDSAPEDSAPETADTPVTEDEGE